MRHLVSVAVVLIIAFWGLKWFQKRGILDKPGSDLKNTRAPVPTLQWVFVILAIMVVVGICFPSWYSSPLFLGMLIPSLLIGTVEFMEELSYLGRFPKIPPFVRLIVHLLAAGLAIGIWGMGNQELILLVRFIIFHSGSLVLHFWGGQCFVSMLSIDLMEYMHKEVAFQQFDSLHSLLWLSGWYSSPMILSQILKSFFCPKYVLYPFVISLVYAVIEYKPLGLVRDVGIMVFGFAIAYLSVLWGVKVGTILVALSLPLFDAIWVGLYRIFVMKKNPLNGDYTHFHHRLMGLWFSRGETRGFIRIRSIIMMVLMILQWADRFNKNYYFYPDGKPLFWDKSISLYL